MSRLRWLAFPALLLTACTTTPKTVEMLAEGDTRILRPHRLERTEPDRPRMLVLLIDGIGRDLLYDLLKGGELPELSRLLGGEKRAYANAYFEPRMLSTLPSSTIPAWSTALTGVPPGEHGASGNEFFIRKERRFAAPIPGTFTDASPVLSTFTDDYVNDLLRVPTVYERMRAAEPEIEIWVAMHQIYRGADRLLLTDRKTLAQAFEALIIEGFLDEVKDETSRDFFELLDEKVFDTVFEELEEHGVPDVLTMYLSGTDQYAHVARDGPDKARTEYLREVLEPKFAKLREILEAKGAFDDLYVVLTADHGHTEVVHEFENALSTSLEEDPPAVLARADFRVRPFQLEVDDDDDFQAVLAYQGAMAYVYLADRSTCLEPNIACDWRRAPRWKEDVLAAAEAFYLNDRDGVPIAKMKDTLHLILVRPPATGPEPSRFAVYLGGGRTQPIGEWLEANPQANYVALEWRLLQLAKGPYGDHSGDVVLIAHNGDRDEPRERFYFAHRYRSWHGSPSRRDSEIPLIVAHPKRSTAQLEAIVGPHLEEEPFQQKFTDVLLDLRRRR